MPTGVYQRKPRKKGGQKKAGRQKTSPEQRILRNGPVAARLREELAKRGWNTADFLRQIGVNVGQATFARNWISGQGAPGKKWAAKLAALFGLPISEFLPRDLDAEHVSMSNGQLHVPSADATPHRRAPVPEAFAFTVNQDGIARIRLDVTLPLAKARPLFARLIEAGLLPEGKDDSE